jgi:hypothetical protein
MQSNKSHFDMLLNAFGISGKELAELLHIDSSLVSKWKNNKRNMKSNSPHLINIVQHFMSLDSISGYKTIKSLLGNGSDSSVNSQAELSLALKRWLMSNATESSEAALLQDFIQATKKGKEHTYLQFQGNEGKRQAILTMLKIATSFEPAQEIWCCMYGSQEWFVENEDFIQEWRATNLEFLNAGNTIHVIHPLDRQYKVLAYSLMMWLPLYLTGRVYPYYAAEQISDVKMSIFLVKDKLLAFGFSSSAISSASSTLVLTNPAVLNETFINIKQLFDTSSPLFAPYLLKDCENYAKFLSKMVNINEQQYVIMRFPFVNDLGIEEIEQILDDNGIPAEKKKYTLSAVSALKTDSKKSDGNYFRYLILQNQLKELLTHDKIMIDTLSFFCGQPVCISNDAFRSLLHRVSQSLVNGMTDYDIAFLDDIYEKQLNNINMFVKKNSCISVFLSPDPNSSIEPLILTSSEPTVILSLFMYCDRIWRSILPQKRQKEYAANKLHILSKTVFPEAE